MSQITTKLILASGSPRRQDFLRDLKLDFAVDVADVDEKHIGWTTPREYALKTAFAKAAAVATRHPQGTVILAADTIVALDNTIYPKPVDADDARRILRELSGKTHKVITGVAVTEVNGATQLQAVETLVEFKNLTESVINGYVDTGEPLDKAGAYGIQGKGGALVESTRGDWFNIVGLPLGTVLAMLAQTTINVEQAKAELVRINNELK
ncbi:septum formation protein Maf [Candidatus Sumerlaeota bacterium]|nr:Maf family protein [Candidatus Sumerlaeales bacterium]NLD61435.1 septum formation protein Maf [Candidatus Sumerlaeota bacterium]